MKVYKIQQNQTHFGYKMPVKKSYRAMQSYYEVINNKGMAQEYRLLYREAKARLHEKNAAKLQAIIIENAEKYPKKANLKDIIKYIGNTIKLINKNTYERISAFYYNFV